MDVIILKGHGHMTEEVAIIRARVVSKEIKDGISSSLLSS